MFLNLHGHNEEYNFIMTDNRDRDEWLKHVSYVAIIITGTVIENIRRTVLIWALIANWSPESNLSDNFPHIQKSFLL